MFVEKNEYVIFVNKSNENLDKSIFDNTFKKIYFRLRGYEIGFQVQF